MSTSTSIVNWGFISTAAIATKVYEAMQDAPNARVYAVASRSVEKAKQWTETHPNVEKVYGSYDELLQDPEVQAVYIPLPTNYKKEWAIKSAQAGKHILVEKPFPDDINDLNEILQVCKENNVQFMDGTMWVHSRRTHELAKKFQTLGAIRTINAAFTFSAPDEEWLHGGNGRTDKTREPQGCLECAWYPIGGILFAMKYQLPKRVQMLTTVVNKVDTLVACKGALWFDVAGEEICATFDAGYTAAHRCYLEVVTDQATLVVDDLCGGQGKSGDFAAYERNYVGSSYYKLDDRMGKEDIVSVEACNHTKLMVEDFSTLVLKKTIDTNYERTAFTTQLVLSKLFESYQSNNQIVHVNEL